jgi:tetratricopeptide (TPR) repeat protein
MTESDGADSSLMSQAEAQQQLGSVEFKVSCQAEVQPAFDRGLALLHHMTYQESRTTFQKITQADPECAMGYWGEAMTYIHPLWSDPPDQSEFDTAVALVKQAQQRGQKSERESAYIAALEAYFSGDWGPDEAPRLARYADAWNEVHQRFPDDIEAAAFYALANLSTADPSDKSYKKQQESGSLGQHILTKVSGHPGGHHYAIHAYDYPPLSHHGLKVAHSYGTIAPDIPHALHMPTHIFTREGLWQESIDWNLKSAEAALKSSADKPLSLHYLHALDYLVYAYLQRAEDQKAQGVMATMAAIDSPIQPHGASAYTLAAIPARLALERQQWQQAAALQPQIPSSYPWSKFPAMEAITHFARALGAARTGDSAQAQQDLDSLAALKAKLPPSATYWATQIEIQHQSALAWLQYQQGDQTQALATMQQAAMLEASTEKHPITPGEVLSAHELYADMLLEMERFDEALAQYKASLERNPNRLNSLYGAAYACESRGDTNMAKAYYQQLVAIAESADTKLERLSHAIAYLKGS